VISLRSHNCYLEAQIKVLEKEKEIHVSTHAKEKVRLESIIKELNSKLSNEQKEYVKQTNSLKTKILELETNLEDEKQKRILDTKKYKSKLESKEKELVSIIRDKEKYIHQLQIQLGQGKCSRICSYNSLQAATKRANPRKSATSAIKLNDNE
jgi:hypothetical protein